MKDTENKELQNDVGGIELDKINVSASPKQPTKASESKAESTEQKLPNAITRIKDKISRLKGWVHAKIHHLIDLAHVSVKNKVFICSFLGGLAVAIPVVLYCLTWADRHGDGVRLERGIVYVVSSSVGDRNFVRCRLLIPFETNEQKNDLMQKLHRIRHVLSNSEDHPEVAKPVSNKDRDAMNEYILGIVNGVTGIPIPDLGLEELFLD